jgi:D-lactate dehydrogenase
MISDDAFSKMKGGVVLINTSRGDVLDIKALAKAIGEGKVAAAGLDVLPEEGGIREEAELLRMVYDRKYDLETMLLNHILLRLRNVIITPHSAFNTREAVERILSTTVGNIVSFTRNEPENVIPGKQT